MKMKRRPWILVALFLLIGSVAWGQTPEKKEVAPDAAVRAALRLEGTDSPAVAEYGADELIACFRQGGKAALLMDTPSKEVWSVSENGPADNGWVAVFNKSGEEETVFAVSHAEMGLHTCPGNYSLFHVLGGYPLKMDQEVAIAPTGVLFIRYLSLE